MSLSPFLSAAIDAARAGEAVIRHYYKKNTTVRLKEDRSPVTQADVETEQAIRAILQTRFPDHGFYGEETGKSAPEQEYVWLVDPIDGTKSFIRDYPFFSTQIALRRGKEFIVGVSNAPLFGELAYAEQGHGAFLNNQPIHVSPIREFAHATLSLGNIQTLTRDRRWSVLGQLIPGFNRVRGYGDFYHYHLLAAGKVDVVVESDVNILDIAALSVIVTEAGGQMTTLDGSPLNLDSTTVLASNGPLQQPLLQVLTP